MATNYSLTRLSASQTSAENLGLRCPAHNALEADRDYGAGFMARKRTQQQKPLKVREPLARYALRRRRCATLGDFERAEQPEPAQLWMGFAAHAALRSWEVRTGSRP